jgi:protein involved in polysaccharide export with SLBB domain
MEMRRYLCVLYPVVLVVVLTACGSPPPAKIQAQQPSPEEVQKILHSEPLQVGDKVTVEISGIQDRFDPLLREVKDEGIDLPYIGNIPATGKTPSQLEKDIKAAYEPKWYPHVNVTVTPVARYFYVMGQVQGNAGGRIPYTGPITVLGAIAAAADFTPFADKKHVQITRADGKTIVYVNCVKALKHPELDLQVYPGDKIMVPRRIY